MNRTSRILMVAGFVAICVWAPCRAADQRPDPFDRWDRNADGQLTRDELPAPLRPNFDRVDADRDGVISRAEHDAFRRRPAGPRRDWAPEGIEIQRDLPYAGTENPRQRVDLLLPRKRRGDKPLPVAVWIHGGAWRAGDKRGGLGRLGPLVASGDYAGVSIGYRLTGEAIWPAQIHDCKAALRWIRANAEKYNLDPERIGVWGSSAGGHLVAMLGTSGDVEDLEGKLGEHTDRSSRVQCVVDYYGPSDLLTMGKYPSHMKHDAPDSPESKLVGGPVQEMKEKARAASPTSYVSADDPPFLIVHGDRDMTVPYNQSQRLDTALREAGVDSTFITIEGGGHGGFRSREVLGRVRAFFDKHLRGRDVEVSGEAIRQGEGDAGPR